MFKINTFLKFLSCPTAVVSKSPARRESSAGVTSPSDEKHSRETERLNKQISRYREIIEEQELLIQVNTLLHVFLLL